MQIFQEQQKIPRTTKIYFLSFQVAKIELSREKFVMHDGDNNAKMELEHGEPLGYGFIHD